MTVLGERALRSARDIGTSAPDDFGVFAIRLRTGAEFLEPFRSLLDQRDTRLIYIGKPRSRPCWNVCSELATTAPFISSIGAVLGYRPPFGSLAGRARVQNYRFAPPDRIAIVEWINASLEVS